MRSNLKLVHVSKVKITSDCTSCFARDDVIIYCAPLIISSTTSGFNKVEVSPKLEVSFSATFLKILLMILPERVLGNPWHNLDLIRFGNWPNDFIDCGFDFVFQAGLRSAFNIANHIGVNTLTFDVMWIAHHGRLYY